MSGMNEKTSNTLSGLNILVTRPQGQAQTLQSLIDHRGGHALLHPVIKIVDPPDWGSLDTALAMIGNYDWIVFSSVNGVNQFHRRAERILGTSGAKAWKTGPTKIAAVGPSTEKALAQMGIECSIRPDNYRAEALADTLAEKARGKRFLLIRADRGRDVLSQRLKHSGGVVTEAVAYSSTDVASADPATIALMAAGEIDWVTITSSAIGRSCVLLFGEALRKTRIASISPITSGTLRELGFSPAAEATSYTMQGLIDAIVEHQASSET